MIGPAARKTAYLGLGSNLGDRLAAMRAAVAALDTHSRIWIEVPSGVASLYKSTAVFPGSQENDQPAYLNSAVCVETTLAPNELLGAVLDIEATLGRVRRRRWEARIIDIDLLLYDELVLRDNNLRLPHPRLMQRRFVLEPLAEIAGDLLHPTLCTPIACLARTVTNCAAGGELLRVADQRWVRSPVAVGSNEVACR